MLHLIVFYILFLSSQDLYSQSEVKIGNQVWMSKNLDVITFRNGDTIPEAKNKNEWREYQLKYLPAICYVNFDKKNKNKYGVTYNRFAVSDPRGLAPIGWKIPVKLDWDKLIENIGGKQHGIKLMSKSGWPNQKKGNNSTGFNAVPGSTFDNSDFRINDA